MYKNENSENLLSHLIACVNGKNDNKRRETGLKTFSIAGWLVE
jgi:hypothetical protein